MRLITVLAFAALLASCQPPAETPVGEPEPALAPVMPADAPPQEEVPPPGTLAAEAAGPAGCTAEIGEAAAARLVERCIAVSPATRPPCNTANPCALIQGEIDRSCGQYDEGEAKPSECTP